MKQRFTSIDVRAIVNELRDRVVNLRLQNVYDVNSKTFLLKFARSDKKELILLESGIRIHSTQYTRDKANMPSNFCMKLRKHIRMRRLTNVRQLGTDRIVHFEFLGNEADGDFHLFVEFYASGNIILTDHAFNIIALLRVVQPSESVRFAVREPYPLSTDTARRDWQLLPSDDDLKAAIRNAVQGAAAKDNLKRTLGGIAVLSDLGPVLIEHAIRVAGLEPQLKVASDFDAADASPQMTSLMHGLKESRDMLAAQSASGPRKGYIIGKPLTNKAANTETDNELIYDEFHPFICAQHRALPHKEFDSFDACVDEFYTFIESQKLETKTVQQEVDADKKLNKIKRDQFSRASSLAVTQTENERRAELILNNLDLVERSIKYIRQHVEDGTDWKLLWRMIQNRRKQLTQTDADRAREEEVERKKAEEKEAKRARAAKALGVEVSALKPSEPAESKAEEEEEEKEGSEKVVRFAAVGTNGVVRRAREPDHDPVLEDDIAMSLVELKLTQNKFILALCDTNGNDTANSEAEDDSSSMTTSTSVTRSSNITNPAAVKVSIDTSMTAYANARSFYDQKRQSAVKHTKTMAQAEKAFKSAEKKIRQDLHQVKITATINRMRKPFWFEKFMWFISSEGYLVIAGRDMQQNELIVKRHLRKDDKYVHADLHGAATVVVKNPHTYPPPPSTMFQAGVMSVCQSRAWEAKMLASAYWVNSDQVSKTAPSGEYLSTRNFLPPVNLVYGFGYLFKIDESCVAAHVLQQRAENQLSSTEETAASEEERRWRERHSHYEYTDEASSKDTTNEATDDTTEQVAKPVKTATSTTAESTTDKSQSKPAKKHLSAKERRDLKKGKPVETSYDTESKSDKVNNNNIKKKQAPTKAQPAVPQNKVRGKGRKSNKKDHWSDSEPETDELKPRRGRTDSQLGELVHQLTDLSKSKEVDQLNEDEQPLNTDIVDETEPSINIEEEEDEDEEGNSNNEQDGSEMEEDEEEDEEEGEGEEKEEIRRLMAEENIAVLDNEDADNLSFMDALVGTPLPDDVIHFAIPICAPYAALQRSCKVALDHFLRQSNITQRERELLKSVPETEQIAAMLAKVRVVTGDGQSNSGRSSSNNRRKR
ncbi:fibronectin-binding protein A N-terminus-domain-containing protein [Syncephalis fuscata]|nr:fibronectin-binding protein A N-terminus-domain-containing protein [Syncephalis fuscata]